MKKLERLIRGHKRAINTKNSVKELRKDGFVPGVLYGKKVGNIPISVKEKDMTRMGGSQVIEISLPQKKYPAVIKEIQTHPITGDVQHVDFQQVDMSKEIRSEVLVHVIGEAIGVKKGGALQYGERRVEVEALPKDLPENFEIDISNMDIGDKFTVQNLQDITQLKITSDMEGILAQIVVNRQMDEEIEDTEEIIVPADKPQDIVAKE